MTGLTIKHAILGAVTVVFAAVFTVPTVMEIHEFGRPYPYVVADWENTKKRSYKSEPDIAGPADSRGYSLPSTPKRESGPRPESVSRPPIPESTPPVEEYEPGWFRKAWLFLTSGVWYEPAGKTFEFGANMFGSVLPLVTGIWWFVSVIKTRRRKPSLVQGG